MGARDEMTIERGGSKCVEELRNPFSLMVREEFEMYGVFSLLKSFGVSQTMPPSQKSGLLVEGVEPE